MNFYRFIFCALLAGIFAHSFAEQFTVLDETFLHDSWHENWKSGSEWAKKWPDNWKSPIDYAGGDGYFRIEVQKFNNPGTVYQCQPCVFWGDGGEDNHACFTRGKDGYTFPETETRYLKKALPGMWRYSRINWSDVNRFMIIDNSGNKGKAGATLRFELIVVAKGSAFSAPSHWIEPANWDACEFGCKENDGVSVQRKKSMLTGHTAQKKLLNKQVYGPDNVQAYSIRGQRINKHTPYPCARGVYIVRTKQNENAELVTEAFHRRSSF